MFKSQLRRCAIVGVFALPLCAFADTFNAKPGLWEMTSTTVITGIPIPADSLAKLPPDQRARIEENLKARDGKPDMRVSNNCVTQKDLDQDMLFKTSSTDQCVKKIIARSPTKVAFRQTCPAPAASSSLVNIEAKTPESLAASIDISQANATGKIHIDVKGRWLSATCPQTPRAQTKP